MMPSRGAVILFGLISLQFSLAAQFDNPQWEALDIVVFVPQNYPNIPQNMMDGLASAVKSIRSIVQVRHFEGNDFIGAKTIAKCTKLWTPNEKLFALTLLADGHYFAHSANLTQGLKLSDYAATPISARLIICPHNPLWEKFQSARDVFLHELMHALGFGLIIPKDDRDVGQNRTFIWRYGSSGEVITTHFMDFQSTALRYAREHFGCSQLQGIESEDRKKIHLSEYVYGEEAEKIVCKNILCRSWYKTNASFVIAETKAYWYGHKWGCEFVQSSCFDFIATRSQRRQPIPFPFCSHQNILSTIGSFLAHKPFAPHDVCFSNGTVQKRINVHCNLLAQVRSKKSSIGLRARPLMQLFGTLQMPWLKPFYGSEDTNRYCPFVQEVVNDWIPDLPDNTLVVDCATVNVRPESVRPAGHTDSNDREIWMIKDTL